MWKGPGSRAAGEGEGRRSLQEHLLRLCHCAACVLWLCLKWQIPFQSQQRGTAAPALGEPVWVCLGTCSLGLGCLPTAGNCRNCSSPAPSGAVPAAWPAEGMFQNVPPAVSHVQVHKRARWSCMALVFFSHGKFVPCFWNMSRRGWFVC